MDKGSAALQLHLEPDEAIEVVELTAALNSIGRQYQVFAADNDYVSRTSDAKLLVSSVSPGSIDISFLPDLSAAVAIAAPFVDQLEVVTKFAGHIKTLLDKFRDVPDAGLSKGEVSLRDCDDAINIVRPVAEHGGSQTFNTFNGDLHQPILVLNVGDARGMLKTRLVPSTSCNFRPLSAPTTSRWFGSGLTEIPPNQKVRAPIRLRLIHSTPVQSRFFSPVNCPH